MGTELSRELFPDDILWFLQDMKREIIDEVDTLIHQIEVNKDERPLSSTQQVDSASAICSAVVDNLQTLTLWN